MNFTQEFSLKFLRAFYMFIDKSFWQVYDKNRCILGFG